MPWTAALTFAICIVGFPSCKQCFRQPANLGQMTEWWDLTQKLKDGRAHQGRHGRQGPRDGGQDNEG